MSCWNRIFLLAIVWLVGCLSNPWLQADLFVSGYNSGRIYRYDAVTGAPLVAPGTFDFGGGNADGMSFDALGRLHVATTDTGGVGRIRRFSNDFSTVTTISTVSGASFLDQTSNGSHIFQATFSQIYRANLDGSGIAPFISPTHGTDGIRIGPSGFLYVVNADSGLIDRYNPTTGSLVTPFLGSTGVVGIGSQMEFGPDGRVYVSRTIGGEARIYRYSRFNPSDVNSLLDPSTEELFGSLGSGLATGIRFGPDGRLYANNYGSNSVWRSNADLSITGMSVFIASGVGGLDGPGSLIFSPIPEPTGFGLATALVGLFGLRRRRRVAL